MAISNIFICNKGIFLLCTILTDTFRSSSKRKDYEDRQVSVHQHFIFPFISILFVELKERTTLGENASILLVLHKILVNGVTNIKAKKDKCISLSQSCHSDQVNRRHETLARPLHVPALLLPNNYTPTLLRNDGIHLLLT